MNELHDRVFFTDRDLGKQFPAILREAGLTVEIHDDHFDQVTTDEEWLAFVGAKSWIAVSRNRSIRYNAIERDTAMRCGVALFFVRGTRPHREPENAFLTNIPNIERFLERTPPPFIANIYMPTSSQPRGRVTRWLDRAGWDVD